MLVIEIFDWINRINGFIFHREKEKQITIHIQWINEGKGDIGLFWICIFLIFLLLLLLVLSANRCEREKKNAKPCQSILLWIRLTECSNVYYLSNNQIGYWYAILLLRYTRIDVYDYLSFWSGGEKSNFFLLLRVEQGDSFPLIFLLRRLFFFI